MRVLHIVATPRTISSRTLQVSGEFFRILLDAAPDISVETLDLYADDLPNVAGTNIEAKYTLLMGAPIDPEHAESWAQIERLIDRFLAAEVVVMSVPMWNLSIPYALKYFIDAIVQPGYLFRYDENGVPEGLVHDKRMVVITSRGGDYSAGSPQHAFDFMEPYIRAIFGFVGMYDIEFVYAQPVDVQMFREDAMQRALVDAGDAARRLLEPRVHITVEALPDGLIPPVIPSDVIAPEVVPG